MCNLPHNFLCSISTTMFPRSVLNTRRVDVRARALKRHMSAHVYTCSHTKRRVFAHFFDLQSHVYA